MVAEDAHLHGHTAAQMLVALKHAWATLEEARSISPIESRELLVRLVTLSINAYYDASPLAHGAEQQGARPVV